MGKIRVFYKDLNMGEDSPKCSMDCSIENFTNFVLDLLSQPFITG